MKFEMIGEEGSLAGNELLYVMSNSNAVDLNHVF